MDRGYYSDGRGELIQGSDAGLVVEDKDDEDQVAGLSDRAGRRGDGGIDGPGGVSERLAEGTEGAHAKKDGESFRGFLVYVARMYKAMVPYLKGIHLSLDSWRANRDEDGWRITNTVEPRVEIMGKEKTQSEHACCPDTRTT
jgi:hypothetical protein